MQVKYMPSKREILKFQADDRTVRLPGKPHDEVSGARAPVNASETGWEGWQMLNWASVE